MFRCTSSDRPERYLAPMLVTSDPFKSAPLWGEGVSPCNCDPQMPACDSHIPNDVSDASCCTGRIARSLAWQNDMSRDRRPSKPAQLISTSAFAATAGGRQATI
jgi:hypothetical protein